MLLRHTFLQSLPLFTGSLYSNAANANAKTQSWFMSDEGEPHSRTWMAFIASNDIWHESQIPEVHRNLALIAIPAGVKPI